MSSSLFRSLFTNTIKRKQWINTGYKYQINSSSLTRGLNGAAQTTETTPKATIGNEEMPRPALQDNIKYLRRSNNRHLAYCSVLGDSPTVVYCHGFQSDMTGAKPGGLEQFCRNNNLGFLKFDFTGCGHSGGNLEDVTFTTWRDDVLTVIDYITAGPLILVGCNVSAWLMIKAALRRPHRVHSLIAISPTVDLAHQIEDPLTPEQQSQLQNDGIIKIRRQKTENMITKKFLEDAENNKILEREGGIQIRCPVRILHGLKDRVVSSRHSIKLSQRLQSSDVQVIFNKSGDHYFRRTNDMQLLFEEINYLIYGSWDARNLSIVSYSNFAVYKQPDELL